MGRAPFHTIAGWRRAGGVPPPRWEGRVHAYDICGVPADLTYIPKQSRLRSRELHFAFPKEGVCTFLVMCGATIEEIKMRGDWASETVYAYLRTPLAVRIINDMRVAASLTVSQ